MSVTRRVTAGATLAAALVALPVGAAQAAVPKAPVNDVITAAQFPGFKVVEKPTITKADTSTPDVCDIKDPADAVGVITSLVQTKKVSATVTTSLSVSEQLVRVSTWQAAHVYFAKVRGVLRSCSTTDGDAHLVSTAEAAPVLPGSDEAFVAVETITSKSETLTARISTYRAGRDIVIVTATQATATTSGKDVKVTLADTATTRALAQKAVVAALARLG